MNSSIILLSYSNLFNSAISIVLSFPPPNSFIKSTKILPLFHIPNFLILDFPKHSSSKHLLIPLYIRQHLLICSFTAAFLILILINNLHAIKNPNNFLVALSNICGLATSMFDPVLGSETAAPTLSATNSTQICNCITASCSYCCQIIACKLC